MVKITNCMSWSYLSSFGPKPSSDNQVCCCSYKFIPVLSMFGSEYFQSMLDKIYSVEGLYLKHFFCDYRFSG